MTDERTALLFANGLGDHLLALPALRAIVAARSGEVVLLTGEGPTDLLFAGLGVAATHRLPMDIDLVERRFDAADAASLTGPVDMLVSLVPWHSASVDELLAALRPARAIGFHPAFDMALPLDYAKHSADLAFDASRAVDPTARLEDHLRPPPLPPEAVALAAAVRAKAGPGRRLLAVHDETKLAKRYPAPQLEAALAEVLEAHPDVLVLGLGHDEAAFDTTKLGNRAIPCVGLPTAAFVALIASADAFLGADSFGLHVADLWGVPSVGLFGPTSAAEFGFRFTSGHVAIQGPGTVASITPHEVAAATGRQLAPSPT